jgi:stage II sporulation protein P
MYSTHSDESYVPTDGASSLWENAGIYDVGNALKENLEKKGITVEYSEKSFLPHDADAYNRSRSTVEDYVKKMPDAIIDIHRDGVDAEEYETEVKGEDTSMVRLFVGRSNQNSAENKAFAQRLKAAADEAYPGLIKDIYIGKGNYNQELYPQAILLEFGTYEIEKEKAISATEYMADVIDEVLFGGTASAATGEKNFSAAKGIGWAIGIAIVFCLFGFGPDLATYGLIMAALMAIILPRYLERAWRCKLNTARMAMIVTMVIGLVAMFVVTGMRNGFSFRAQ